MSVIFKLKDDMSSEEFELLIPEIFNKIWKNKLEKELLNER